MNEAAVTQPFVVISLGAAAREDYTIELARELAQSEAPELLGLFVEDADLLEHARSQRAREVLLTGEERALDRGSLERQLRSLASQVRTRFETATTRLGLRHRFEIAHGNVLAETIRRAAAAEALVVSLSQLGGTGAGLRNLARMLIEANVPRVLLAREGWNTGRSVIAVVNDVASSGMVIDVATRIAKRSGSPVFMLLPSTGEASAAELVERAEDELRLRGVLKADVLAVSGTGAGGILSAARACRARLLVLTAPSGPVDLNAVDELIRRFSGALMLVRP